MSELSSVQGSVTLRKLRSGTTATISLSSSMQLFQLYNDEVSPIDFAPNWETGVSGSYPIITVNASASQGELKITDVLWKINNTNATSINGVSKSSDSSGRPILIIQANLAKQTILNFNSGTLTAEITFEDASGTIQTVTKSEIIRVQKAMDSGYNVMINANKTYVDDTTSASNPTTLTAVCYKGTSPTSDVTFKWLKSTTEVPTTQTPTGSTYKITDPDTINGSQLFICRAYDGSGTEVDAEGIMIIDNSDPCYIVADVQQSKGGTYKPTQENVTSVNVAHDNDATQVTFKVQNSDGTDYGSVKSWTAEKKHADTMKLIGKVSGASYTTDTDTVDTSYNTQTAANAATVSISVLDADYVSNSGSYGNHDTEVIVTATATI